MKKLFLTIFLLFLTAFQFVRAETELVPDPLSFGIGIERFNTTADVLNTLSFLLDNRSYNFRVGVNFGFADSMDDLILGPKFQYIFFGKKYFELFAQTGIYYRRHFRVGDGLNGNVLSGVEFKIPELEMIRISLAYGIVWDAIDQTDFSMNHGDVFGNLAIHYFF